MKKIILLAVIAAFTFTMFCADDAKDKARIKRNDDWKNYVDKMSKSLSEAEFSAFQALGFESRSPGNDFEFIKDQPLKKYKISKYEKVKIATNDKVKLDAWFFPVENAKGTLVILHGHGSDMEFGLYQSRFLIEKGYQLLIYNARFWSFSKTPEKYQFSIEQEMADVGSVIEYLKKRKDVNMDKLGIFGFSQGAYKAVLAGARYQEFKVVMEDAGPHDRVWFDNAPEISKLIQSKNGEDFTSELYDAAKQVAKISPRPLLILHGGNDNMVPLSESQMIFDGALDPKEYKIFPKSGHCLGMVQSDKVDYIATVTAFLEKYLQ